MKSRPLPDRPLQMMFAPEAAALYERFSELVPSNATGDQMTKSANHHEGWFYARAAALLNSQIKTRLEGEDAFDAVRRLSYSPAGR